MQLHHRQRAVPCEAEGVLQRAQLTGAAYEGVEVAPDERGHGGCGSRGAQAGEDFRAAGTGGGRAAQQLLAQRDPFRA